MGCGCWDSWRREAELDRICGKLSFCKKTPIFRPARARARTRGQNPAPGGINPPEKGELMDSH